MPRHVVSPVQRAQARRLRRETTDAEARLWSCLRGHRFLGVSFRRQAPIGPYVVDLLCPAARLVIEVDGGQHGEAAGLAHDRKRTAWLASAGYSVLRLWNHDVLAETSAVLERIFVALAAAGVVDAKAEPPLPVPPPPRGRERTRQSPSRDVDVSNAVAADETASPLRVSASTAVVPSPLEGEGQGGGETSPATLDVHPFPAPKIGSVP